MDASIVLSSQPSFRFRDGPSIGAGDKIATPPIGSNLEAKMLSALIAQSLSDDGYGVEVSRLQWDVRLAFVWTRVNVDGRDMAFGWNRYRHPSPLRLLRWVRDWEETITELTKEGNLKPDRIAYAWIWHQLRWMSEEGLSRELPGVENPCEVDIEDLYRMG